MKNFFQNTFSGMGITDIIDIILVAMLVYAVLLFIRKTRAEQLVKGLIILVALAFISEICNFYALNWILRGATTIGLVALVVIFQPELRRGLEFMGRTRFIKSKFGQLDKERAKKIAAEFAEAISYFSQTKTGALIVIERETTLDDIAETGTFVNADISAQLLGNLFYEGAPLHDGAVLIRDERIAYAGCVLPLTHDNSLSKELGTRHRAAIGITENSDAIVFVVSEETGIISMSKDGKLSRFLDAKTVEKELLTLYCSSQVENGIAAFKSLLRKENADESK